ncbi:MAG: hypothetical protein AAF741_09740 [Bacteroidota bacterium]
MDNEDLKLTWNSQKTGLPFNTPAQIIAKAKGQRRSQIGGIVIMLITVLLLIVFTILYAGTQWNNFSLGLTLMISSLVFRIALEFIYLFKINKQMVSLDSKTFRSYVKSHYRARLRINYIITPLCLSIYVFGFMLLIPYFKAVFSSSFYTYILVSGAISLVVVSGLIARTIRKETQFLKRLNDR